MRIGLTTFNPVERLALALGLYPSPLLSGFWGMASSRTLMAAVELGVFESLAEEPLSAPEVAARTGCTEVGTEALLNALNGFGFLRRRNGRYRNSRAVQRWLTRGSRYPLDGAFGLFAVLWDELGDVEERLRSTEPRDFHANRDETFWRRYQTGLAQFARLTAPEIVRKVKIAGAPARLLDVGGGHAMYSSAFCRRYPDLTAEVIDYPGAAAVGRSLVSEAGLEERVLFREEDLTVAEWGTGYDLVLLFNVIHTLTPQQVGEVFRKAHAALRSGGTFVVLDSAHRGDRGDIDTAGGANELLFYVINNTRAYPEEAVAEWMRSAGFAGVRTRHLLTVPQAALTIGTTADG